MILSPYNFFQWNGLRTIVDIRPDDAFRKGSFPRSVSIPVENYIRKAELVVAIQKIHKKDTLHIIDHDGNTANEILSLIDCYVLEGGYKNFKNWRDNTYSDGPPIGIIGGKTGSQKTEMLRTLSKMNRQVIDLEQLAKHKGSVFGNLSGKQQPSFDFFQNKLLELWVSCNPEIPVWIEEKGPILGQLGLPKMLYNRMLGSFIIHLDVPFETRLAHIQNEYLSVNSKLFAECIRKLEKRTGVSANHQALHYYATGQTEKCLRLLLHYYDQSYEKRRGLYQAETILCINPSQLENEEAINYYEKEIMTFHKKRGPAVLPQGTLINVNQH